MPLALRPHYENAGSLSERVLWRATERQKHGDLNELMKPMRETACASSGLTQHAPRLPVWRRLMHTQLSDKNSEESCRELPTVER